jgi:hypothetical protein
VSILSESIRIPSVFFGTLLLAAGCTGSISDASGSGAAAGGGSGIDGPHASGIAATGRLLRLSHGEYDNTLHDLLGLPVDEHFTEGFVDDGGERTLRTLDARLASAYQDVAERLAERMTGEDASMAPILPCDASEGAACKDEFLAEFGLRAFRRPLTDTELVGYGALFDRGPDFYADMPPLSAGVRAVVEAMLQSPHFLYRVEWSEEEDADGIIALEAYDLANRLSYLLWRSMPDEELLAAAAAGELETEEQVTGQTLRMLEDPRAREMVQDFHADLLELDRYRDLTRDPALSATFGESTTEAMRNEVRLFVDDVFVSGGGLYELMTSNVTFVNSELAELYGLSGTFGDEMVRVELDPSERAGLLTQVGFLAVNADYASSDPIHRGLFINERILCTDLPPPPDGADTTLEPITTTKRAQVEEGTLQPGTSCVGCHGIINPPGFALESFDAVGRFRVEDNGYSVDSTADVQLDGDEVAIEGGVDLAYAIAESDAAAHCYARHWVDFVYAREATPEDEDVVARLGAQIADGSLDIRTLLVELTKTRSFTSRRDER